MSSFKKIWAALKKAVCIVQKEKSVGSVQKGIAEVAKSIDADAVRKDITKGVKDKAGVDLDKVTQDIMKAGKQAPGIPMKFPYTFTAKIAHFPWRYYAKNNWMYRYYFISIIVCLPMFAYFNGISNAPGNVQKWKEIRKHEAAEHHH